MKKSIQSFPLALRMILTDPINLSLAIVPTLMAVGLYLLAVLKIFKNSDRIVVLLRDYIHTPEAASWTGKVLTAVMILFVFLLMSWTFVIVVSILSAPFNSMLSGRIEKKLIGERLESNRSRTFKEVFDGIGATFKNELKKLVLLLVLSLIAFLMNFLPLLYPVSLFLASLLVAIQFLDYSWSRRDWHFGTCLTDILQNIFAYAIGGFVFLLLMTIPLVNTIVPALGTSYFTVLWVRLTHPESGE